MADRPSLPDDVVPYRTSDVFTEDTLPDGLRRIHTTQPGVWVRVDLEAGELTLHLPDADLAWPLRSGQPGVIPPETRHAIAPKDGPLRFTLTFFRRPEEDNG